jgi:GNAT superfamily N-acetyltransferase
MKQLRSHLSEQNFIDQVNRQTEGGYRLAFVEVDGAVTSVAGFRISECLAWGVFMYVDDLVTDENIRSKGYGKVMLSWLLQYAERSGCKQLHLDSGVQRFGAHRFYLTHGMDITCHHFGMMLGES